jgi:hypothetical protein
MDKHEGWSERLFDQVEIPERNAFSQRGFTAYDVTGNAISDIIGQLTGQGTCDITGGIAERMSGRTTTCALFSGIDRHHSQGHFALVGDDF